VQDQWLPPFVITDEAGAPVGTVEDGDAVVLFNFR
jgi:2,3-bisphosphoglycerate-independent phosphoglycerate mutase